MFNFNNLNLYSPYVFAGIIAISGISVNILKNAKKESLKTTNDGQSILIFRLITPLSMLVAFYPLWFNNLTFFDSLGLNLAASTQFFFGAILFISGLALRWWAILTLKEHFTVKISILQNHQLVESGPFKILRHPSYTGLLVYYLGLGISIGNWFSIICLMLGNLITILNRIPKEESTLESHFGVAYQAYKRRTWRLIPWLY